jgi:hypothetical protein
MTAADRCVGHVGGTAGEDGGARSLVRWPPARPQGEAVLDDHVPRWQALRRRRGRYCGDIHRHQPIHATPTVLIAVTVGNHRIDLRCGLLSLDPPKRLCGLVLSWQVESRWQSPGAASRRCTPSAVEMALLRGQRAAWTVTLQCLRWRGIGQMTAVRPQTKTSAAVRASTDRSLAASRHLTVVVLLEFRSL